MFSKTLAGVCEVKSYTDKNIFKHNKKYQFPPTIGILFETRNERVRIV